MTTKKRNIIIISIASAVVVLLSVLLPILLIPKYPPLSKLLNNVGDALEENNRQLVDGYNSKETQGLSQTVSTASQKYAFASNEESGWEITEGEDTFEYFLASANDVIGFYAISEYLNEQLNPLKLNKTYIYKSSVITYYAVASRTDTTFSFKLHNPKEDVVVVVNHTKDTLKPLSVEFTERNTYTTGLYYYQYSVIDFEEDTFDQVSYYSKDEIYINDYSKDDFSQNVEEYNSCTIDYKNANFEGVRGKNKDKAKGPKDEEFDKFDNRTKKNGKFNVFKNFDKNFDTKNPKTFPNPEDLIAYSFNKYIINLEEDNGKYILSTRQRKGIDQEVLNIFNDYAEGLIDYSVDNFDAILDYDVNGKDIRKTVDSFIPDINAFQDKLTDWLAKKYDPKEYYFKAQKHKGINIHIGANSLIICNEGANTVNLLSITKGYYNEILYFQTTNEGVAKYRVSYNLDETSTTPKYKNVTAEKYTTNLNPKDLKMLDYNDNAPIVCDVLTHETMSYEMVETSTETMLVYKYASKPVEVTKDTVYQITKTGSDEQQNTVFETNVYNNVAQDLHRLLSKVKDNTSGLPQGGGSLELEFLSMTDIVDVTVQNGFIIWEFKEGVTLINQMLDNQEVPLDLRSYDYYENNKTYEITLVFIVMHEGKIGQVHIIYGLSDPSDEKFMGNLLYTCEVKDGVLTWSYYASNDDLTGLIQKINGEVIDSDIRQITLSDYGLTEDTFVLTIRVWNYYMHITKEDIIAYMPEKFTITIDGEEPTSYTFILPNNLVAIYKERGDTIDYEFHGVGFMGNEEYVTSLPPIQGEVLDLSTREVVLDYNYIYTIKLVFRTANGYTIKTLTTIYN